HPETSMHGASEVESRLGAVLCKPVVAMLAFAALVFLFVPLATAVIGILLATSLAIMATVTATRPVIGRTLGLHPGRPFRGAIKLLLHAGYAVFLMALGYVGMQVQEGVTRQEQEQLARDEVAAQRRQAANAEVAVALKEARAKLNRADIEGAAELARKAVKNALATNLGGAQKLMRDIHVARDPKLVMSLLTSMPDVEFELFRSGQVVPKALDLGFEVLNKEVLQSARQQLEEAATIRSENAAAAQAQAEAMRR